MNVHNPLPWLQEDKSVGFLPGSSTDPLSLTILLQRSLFNITSLQETLVPNKFWNIRIILQIHQTCGKISLHASSLRGLIIIWYLIYSLHMTQPNQTSCHQLHPQSYNYSKMLSNSRVVYKKNILWIQWRKSYPTAVAFNEWNSSPLLFANQNV